MEWLQLYEERPRQWGCYRRLLKMQGHLRPIQLFSSIFFDAERRRRDNPPHLAALTAAPWRGCWSACGRGSRFTTDSVASRPSRVLAKGRLDGGGADRPKPHVASCATTSSDFSMSCVASFHDATRKQGGMSTALPLQTVRLNEPYMNRAAGDGFATLNGRELGIPP
jgi:hypothetical protein